MEIVIAFFYNFTFAAQEMLLLMGVYEKYFVMDGSNSNIIVCNLLKLYVKAGILLWESLCMY